MSVLVTPYIQPSQPPTPRLIVALTTLNGRLVRTRNFKTPTYVGDPINAVKIFSDKSADELVDRDPTQGPPLMGFLDSSFIRPHVKPSP